MNRFALTGAFSAAWRSVYGGGASSGSEPSTSLR
jgi:hypothetical protein